MSSSPTGLSRRIVVRLVVPGNPSLAMPADLAYDTADPYAVVVAFGGTDNEAAVRWVFSRDLMVAGLDAPAGDGDVRIWPSPRAREPIVYLSLSTPTGTAMFTLRVADVVDFLQSTDELVPIGAEHRAGVQDALHAELGLILGRPRRSAPAASD